MGMDPMTFINKMTDVDAEKRSYERKNLSYEQVPGEFHVILNGEKSVFNQVNDVSISGMGILLNKELPANSTVVVGYESEEFCVSINAKVAWTETLSAGAYRIGIHFSNENMDDNVMLFMTLREYIDDFGEEF